MPDIARKVDRVARKSARLTFIACALAFGAGAGSEAAAQRTCPRLEVTMVEQAASAQTREVKHGDHTLFLRRSAITTTSDISELKVSGDDIETLIQIKYKPEAAARLLEATTDHDGLKLAIVADNDVLLAFTWEGRYGLGPDGTQVSLTNGMARAQKLLESMQGCIDSQTP
jgi:hypothetical protein